MLSAHAVDSESSLLAVRLLFNGRLLLCFSGYCLVLDVSFAVTLQSRVLNNALHFLYIVFAVSYRFIRTISPSLLQQI